MRIMEHVETQVEASITHLSWWDSDTVLGYSVLTGKTSPEKGGEFAEGTTEDEMAEWHHRLNGHEFG